MRGQCDAGTYKIPTANDIPLDLRVTLLADAPCKRTPQAHSSKAVGRAPAVPRRLRLLRAQGAHLCAPVPLCTMTCVFPPMCDPLQRRP